MRVYGAACVILGLAGLTIWVSYYPLDRQIAFVLALTWMIGIFAKPWAWLVLMPALWPVVDLATWTGQVHVTESDALVLATLVSLGARNVFQHRAHAQSSEKAPATTGALATVLFALIAVSVSVSTYRGIDHLEQLGRELLVGYNPPFNGVRLAKAYAFAFLLIPFLAASLSRDEDRTVRDLGLGMALGSGTCALAAIWERIAFPGLTNFASDYRTTAMFWEMNVGGAALDGWLAMSLPFALAWCFRARSLWETGIAAAIASIGAYAAFTTFSRGLYGAIGFALGVVIVSRLLDIRNESGKPISSSSERPVKSAGLFVPLSNKVRLLVESALVVVAALASALAFSRGGYRGMGALIGFALIAFLSGPTVSGAGKTRAAGALIAAAALTWVSLELAPLVPKGPYVAFLVSWVCALAMLFTLRASPWTRGRTALLTMVLWSGANAFNVGWHWGGDRAFLGAAIATLIVALPLVAQALVPVRLWHVERKSIAQVSLVLMMCGIVAAITGSYYVGERFSTVRSDLTGRLEHWTRSVNLVTKPGEMIWGIGTGRYAEAFFWSQPGEEYPATWKIVESTDARFLRLGGPRYKIGFGEALRVSQRVPLDAVGPFRFRMKLRAEKDSLVHLAVCRKHLLYPDGCSGAPVPIKGANDWSEKEVVTKEGSLDRTAGLAIPRLTVFVISVETSTTVDVDDLVVEDSQGRSLLENGNFDRFSDHWFITSDRNHLPWHAKNLWVHLYVEQGLVGVASIGLALGIGLFRLVRRGVRTHREAPWLLASLGGFVIVGMFDSLIDVPRLTLPFLLLVWIALALRSRRELAGAR